VRIRALGTCWLEVQTSDGRPVFNGTLHEGEERLWALGAGLRLLAGRPDLLELAIGTGDFSTLVLIDEAGWISLRPGDAAEPAS
jgi:hypothetical protein